MTLTVTAVASVGDVPAVLVDVTSSPAVTDLLRVYRVHEDGTRYRVLTDLSATIITSWSGFDYHAPFNQAVRYVAETDSLGSAASPEVWLVSESTWLIHPSDPDLSMWVDVVTNIADTSYKDRAQRFQVIGKRDPVTRADYPRGGESGSMSVLCDGPESWARLSALFADGGPVLMNLKPLRGFIKQWKWVQPGDLTMSSPTGHDRVNVRVATFPYEEVSPPDADALPVWTFDDVAATFATFDAVAAAYTDFRAMQLDNRS